MKKKLKALKIKIKLIAGAIVLIILLILSTATMIEYDFFTSNKKKVVPEENYVSNNIPYANDYIYVVNKNIRDGNGYVTLSRILYFLLADRNLTYDEIYTDNLDKVRKQEKPISEVCAMEKYRKYSVCNKNAIKDSGQRDSYSAKPFSKPINFTSMNVSSFFMQNRSIGITKVHKAWDFASPSKTPVYAVCNGKIKSVTFPYSNNFSNFSDTQGGNRIFLECTYNKTTYIVWYMHLYPNSYTVKVGEQVTKGKVIAGVGTTGYSTGDHLHYQVNVNGVAVDGLDLVNFNE